MKNLFRFLLPLVLAFCPMIARAQFGNIQTNVTFQGATNNLANGATWTWTSGSVMLYKENSAAATNLLYIADSSGTVKPLPLGAGMSILGGALVAGSSSSANPTALVGLTAVNGSATSFMRSDAAPPLDQSIIPTMTGLWTFSQTLAKTAGTDYGVKITPTLNQRNATNAVALYINETITQAGTGFQYFIESGIGATDFFNVDTAGNITLSTWKGNVIGQAYGGAGTISGVLSATGTGAVSAASSGTGINISGSTIQLASITNGFVVANITGSTGAPSGVAFSSVMDGLGATQGDIAYRNATVWTVLPPGTTGQGLQTQGSGANPQWFTFGNLFNSGTPTTGQFGLFVDATHLSGISPAVAVVDMTVAPVTITTTTPAIDWSAGPVQVWTLTGNSTPTFTNAYSGGVLTVKVINTSTYTVTWPTAGWSGGSQPPQTTGSHYDVWTFIDYGGTFSGSVVQNF